MLKRVPLPRSRVALNKCYNKADNGQDIESDTESHYYRLGPTLRSENADDQDTNAQFRQGNAEEGPGVGEDDPEGGRRDGLV